MAAARRERRRDRRRHLSTCPDGTLSVASARCIRRRSGSSARSAISMGSSRSALPDTRPWLDLGFWDVQHPLGDAAATRRERAPYRVPAGRRRKPAPDSGRPGACRHHRARPFPLHRQRRDRGAARAAARLCAQGHRVADGRRRRSSKAARLAGRTSGDSTVAYALAFARAVEAALGIEAPPRAVYLRALMAELERLANHFGDIGAICNDASFSHHARAMRHPARAHPARGRRLLRPSPDDGPRRARRRCGAISPPSGIAQLQRAASRRSAGAFPQLIELYDNTASLQDRTVTTGILKPRAGAAVRRRRLCRPRLGPRLRCAPARRATRPTTSCTSTCRCSRTGDVNARVWIRIREVEQSLALIEQILAAPAGRRRSRTAIDSRRARAAKASRLSKPSAATCSPGCGSTAGTHRALPPARPVLVPVAAARSRDRGQHRRRLPALQQIVQLLLFGARSLGSPHAQAPVREPDANAR